MQKIFVNVLCLVCAFLLGALTMRQITIRENKSLLYAGANRNKAAQQADGRLDANADPSPTKTLVSGGARAEAIRDRPSKEGGSSPNGHEGDEKAAGDAVFRLAKEGAKVDKMFGAFLRQAALRGADAKKIREILLAREMIASDVFAIAREQGLDVSKQETVKPLVDVITKSRKEFSAEVKLALGDENFKALQVYERMLPERTIANELSGRLEATASLLTEEQRERFIDVLFNAKNSAGVRKIIGSANNDGSFITVIPDSAIDPMRSVLTPEQMAKFMDIQREQQMRLARVGRVPGR